MTKPKQKEKKLTARREAFAQALAKGCTQADAYRVAGYKTDTAKPQTIYNEASKLASNPAIIERLAEISAPILDRINSTALSDVDLIKKTLRDAIIGTVKLNNGQLKAAELLGKIHAIYVEKQQIEDTTPRTAEAVAEQLTDMVKEIKAAQARQAKTPLQLIE